MAIEDMLHGLRRRILFLNPTNLSTFLCLNLYEKFQFSHLQWDEFAINTAQDDIPNCGNSLISSNCNPAELSFLVLPRILLFLCFSSVNIKDLITLSLLKNVIISNDCV